MMDVTRKKVKNWAEDPEWRCCAEGSIGPVSASKQVLLTSMRGLGWLQAVMVLMINEFMKRGLHIGTSSISSILQMTAVEGLLWYSNNTVHLQGKFHFAPVPGAWIMTKYCCKTKSCDQIGHVLRSLDFHSFSMFQRWKSSRKQAKQHSLVLNDYTRICWIGVVRRWCHNKFLCLALSPIEDIFLTCAKVLVVMCDIKKNPQCKTGWITKWLFLGFL